MSGTDPLPRPGCRPPRRWSVHRRRLPHRPPTPSLGAAILAAALATTAGLDAQAARPGPADPGAVAGSEEPFVPARRPTLVVEPAPAEVVVDGRLDDPGWAGAAVVASFTEHYPDEGARPPVRTRALVTYDREHLYVAFVARDDPDAVRASLRDRDEMFSDDFVGILLDTYGNQSWAYEIFVNPLGVQGDLRLTSNAGEDAGFDVLFESAGRVTDDGYRVELAIPFESLRFPDGRQHTWRVNFLRTRPRGSRAQYFWAAQDRDDSCFMCQWGTLTGIEGVSPGGSLEVLPGLVASRSGSLADEDDPGSGFESGSLEAEPSLGLRYAFAGGVTAEATFNPDFSQVESDPGQIDANTTFALFFPERRPFFQEGSDLFETWIDAVYTRSINDPRVAAKLTARTGRTSLAWVGARDERSPLLLPFEERSFVGEAGPSWSNVLRVRRSLGESSHVGALVTDRRLEGVGGSGTTFGADAQLRVGGNYRLEYQLLGSRTVEPDAPSLTGDVSDLVFDRGAHTAAFDGESFWGHAQYASFERGARTWGFNLDYWAYSPTYRADNGFQTRNDRRQAVAEQWLTFYPSGDLLDRIQPFVRVERVWNFDGVVKETNYVVNVNGNLAGQTFFALDYWRDPERFGGIDFDDGWGWNAYAETAFTELASFGAGVSGGEDIARTLETPILGDLLEVEGWAELKPLDRLVLEPRLSWARLRGRGASECAEVDPGAAACDVFDGYILRLRGAFQFSRELVFRLVTQYDGFDRELSVEPLLTYRVNPYTLFYVGASDRRRDFGIEEGPDAGFERTSRQFFAKLQYLLRL